MRTVRALRDEPTPHLGQYDDDHDMNEGDIEILSESSTPSSGPGLKRPRSVGSSESGNPSPHVSGRLPDDEPATLPQGGSAAASSSGVVNPRAFPQGDNPGLGQFLRPAWPRASRHDQWDESHIDLPVEKGDEDLELFFDTMDTMTEPPDATFSVSGGISSYLSLPNDSQEDFVVVEISDLEAMACHPLIEVYLA